MISVPIQDVSGAEVGTYEFPPEDLAPRINKQLLHDVVVMYQANRRVGTVRTKSRSMISGTSKKMYRQKGTGRSRAGSVRSPIRRGGGHTFAKVPVDHGYRLPKKAVRAATRMALLSKFQDGQVTLLDELSIVEPKTKRVAEILAALGLSGVSCLIVTAVPPETAEDDAVLYTGNIWRAARNIPEVWVTRASDLNAYDLLHQRQLVITTTAVDGLRGVGSEAAAAVSGA